MVTKRAFNRKWYDVNEAAFPYNVPHIDKWSCCSFEKWYVRHLVGRRVNKCIKWTHPANERTDESVTNIEPEPMNRTNIFADLYICIWCCVHTQHELKSSIDDNATVFQFRRTYASMYCGQFFFFFLWKTKRRLLGWHFFYEKKDTNNKTKSRILTFAIIITIWSHQMHGFALCGEKKVAPNWLVRFFFVSLECK